MKSKTRFATVLFTGVALYLSPRLDAAISIAFQDMVNNPGVAQTYGSITGTLTRTGAGTADPTQGNGNNGDTRVGGELVIINHESDLADGNNSGNTLNNYVVYSFVFSSPITLSDPFRVHDLDHDHGGNDEYQDAVGLVLGLGGGLTAVTGDQSGSSLPAIVGTSNQDGSWMVTSLNASIAADPTGGPTLSSVGTLPVYMHSNPVSSSSPVTAPNPNHENNDIAVEFDATTSQAFDSLHLVYFNAIDTDETSGVQGVSISNTEMADVVPEPSAALLALTGLAFGAFRRRR